MFQQVYLHKATRSAEWMIRKILRRASQLIADGTRLEGSPRAVVLSANGAPPSLEDYLALDDSVLWVALAAWENASDPSLADLCKRVRRRRLHKTIELFGAQALPGAREDALAIAHDVAEAHGLDPEVHVGLDVAEVTPFGADADPLTVVFAKGEPRPLSEVSFLLARLAGQVLSRVRLVLAPELREDVLHALGMA